MSLTCVRCGYSPKTYAGDVPKSPWTCYDCLVNLGRICKHCGGGQSKFSMAIFHDDTCPEENHIRKKGVRS